MLFRSLATTTLRMQFGHDDPIEVEPGETTEVPDHWVPYVSSRGYLVEPVDAPAPAPVESETTEPAPKKRGRRSASAEGDDAG